MTPEQIAEKFSQIEHRLDQLDARMSTVETHVTGALEQFGDYKNRNMQELVLMRGQIDNMIASIESLVCTAEYQQSNERAKALLRRLKNNQTRVNKALKEK